MLNCANYYNKNLILFIIKELKIDLSLEEQKVKAGSRLILEVTESWYKNDIEKV